MEIRAIRWYFGMNNSEALAYLQTADDTTVDAIVMAFRQCAKDSFYSD